MIVILSDFLYPFQSGGVAKHVHYVVKHFNEQGIEFRCFSRGIDNRNYSLQKSESIPNVVLMSEVGYWNFLKEIIVTTRKADTIVCHYVIQGLFIATLSLFTFRKFNFFFHGPIDEEYFEKEKNKLGRVIRLIAQYYVLKLANKILVHSEYMKDNLEKKLPGASLKTEIIKPFKFPDISQEHEILQKQSNNIENIGEYILISRRLTPRTGVLEFCKFVNSLGNRYLLPPLVITGAGEDKDQIKEIAVNSKNIIFLGHVSESELDILITNANATLLPTKNLEGLGYIILEALQRGTPAIVSSSCGGGTDYLKAKFPKLIFELGNYESIKNAFLESQKINSYDLVNYVSEYQFNDMVKDVYGE